MEDMIYAEIKHIKSDISSFIIRLQEYAGEHDAIMEETDRQFFSVIAKHIVFWKYVVFPNNLGRFYRVLISDGYNYIISIIKNEIRYVYVNERSIIENYIRLIINKTLEEDHVTDKIFSEIKQHKYLFEFTEDEFSLIKSEYSVSCSYIHGGSYLDENLIYGFDECIKNEKTLKNKNKYYARICRMLKILDKMLISTYTDEISGSFFRKKSVLEYLMGKDCLELLFVEKSN